MTSLRSFVLPVALVIGCLLAQARARADSVAFASSEPRTAELLPELTLGLRGAGVLLIARALGDARTPLERAAAAQRIGRNVGAGATLWIEREPPVRVRAVTATGERMFEAPLPAPIELIEPRVFASVATSLVLEALGRAGAADAVPPLATPSSVQAASSGPRVEQLPRTPAAPRARAADGPRRLFFRAGLTAGSVYLRRGAAADRSPAPVLDAVSNDSRAGTPNNAIDLAAADRALHTRGFDCQLQEVQDALRVAHCHPALKGSGFATSLAFDLAAGVRLTDRLGLSLTARIAPHAGLGALAHALFGVQLELALVRARAIGFWLNALAGLGVGRIQAQANAAGGLEPPYATSGLGYARVGVQLGYRFTANVGLYAGPVLQAGFPAQLFALDSSVGLEARL